MDHVFDVEGGFARDLPADAHGPNIECKGEGERRLPGQSRSGGVPENVLSGHSLTGLKTIVKRAWEV